METGPENEVMTIDQMTTLLSDNGMGVINATTALELAQATYVRETDRTRYLSDQSHELSLSERMPALTAAETKAVRMAEIAEGNARRVRSQLAEMARPVLTDAEMTTASARAAVVGIEVEHASAAGLLPGIRRAIALGDRPTQYLYLTMLDEKTRRAPAGETPEDQSVRSEVRRLLSQIRTTLESREFDGLRQKADEALDRAVRAGVAARKRRETAALQADYTRRGFVPLPEEAA